MLPVAWMSKSLGKGVVECAACNHRCRLADGRTGFCGVRRNVDGKLRSLVYGRAASVNVDPIEKKPLFHFLPNSRILSFGTAGCNFRCAFCQNWELSQFPRDHSREELAELGSRLSPREIVAACRAEGIPTIAYTYNEPAVFFEYAYDTAQLAHAAGIKNVFVSNGFETREALTKIRPFLDAMNVDLKSFREEFYEKICGGRLAPVLANIEFLHAQKIWLEITTLVITNENDSAAELQKIAEFIASVSPEIPWHLSRYFPAHKMRNPPTPLATLEKAVEIGKAAGLRNVYVGNVAGGEHADTFCSKCGAVVISRAGYFVENFLEKGRCGKCQNEIAGVFD